MSNYRKAMGKAQRSTVAMGRSIQRWRSDELRRRYDEMHGTVYDRRLETGGGEG